MRLRALAVLAAASLLISSCASHGIQIISPARFVDAVKQTRQPDFRRPGVVAAAVRLDKETVYACAGQQDLVERVPATEKTVYLWFSVTKMFTATAVMQLVEKGKIDLDRSVASYLPEFQFNAGPWAQPTVAQLMSHSAGLPRLNVLERFRSIHLASEPRPSNFDLIKKWTVSGDKLVFEPGTKFEYSNVGYLWLGLLIERVSGVPYEDYVRKNILEPLGMKETGYQYRDLGRAARGYARAGSLGGIAGALLGDETFDAGKAWGYRGIRHYHVDGPSYAGLIGTVPDMTRFVAMQLRKGELDGRRILSEASCERMREPMRDKQGRPLQAGLGWWIEQANGEKILFHEGMGGGFKTQIRLYPSRGYAVVVASNDTEYDTFDITRYVVSAPN